MAVDRSLTWRRGGTPAPIGPPLTCSMFRGVPCWFDSQGWPHSLAALRMAQAATTYHRENVAAALVKLDSALQVRAAVIARLEALEARGE